VGLGALLLPTAALADTTASPSTLPVGGTVTLTSTCSPKSGDAIFHLTGPNRDQRVRSTGVGAGGGLTAEVFTAGFTLGTYTVTTTCGDGSSAGSTTFTVTPIGGVAGGDGGSTDSGALLATGTTLIGAAASGGFLLFRRRGGVSAPA
jgi:hypothetical protein